MPLDNRTCFTVNLRDRLACKNCGKQPLGPDNYHRGFEYHHVEHKAAGGADSASNIALLCHDCHLAGHQGRLDLATAAKGWDLEPPERFSCQACTAMLLKEHVEMNCGWYRCDHCHERTHLWDHFYRA